MTYLIILKLITTGLVKADVNIDIDCWHFFPISDILHKQSLLWLPRQLCSWFHLPSGLEEWLVPVGKCYRCRKPYFKHYCAVQVSGAYYVALTRGVCKPANLALSVDYCSQHCANVSDNVYSWLEKRLADSRPVSGGWGWLQNPRACRGVWLSRLTQKLGENTEHQKRRIWESDGSTTRYSALLVYWNSLLFEQW